MGVMLGDGVELAADQLFELWVDDPLLLLRGFSEHCAVKHVKLLAEFLVVFP